MQELRKSSCSKRICEVNLHLAVDQNPSTTVLTQKAFKKTTMGWLSHPVLTHSHLLLSQPKPCPDVPCPGVAALHSLPAQPELLQELHCQAFQ